MIFEGVSTATALVRNAHQHRKYAVEVNRWRQAVTIWPSLSDEVERWVFGSHPGETLTESVERWEMGFPVSA